MQRPLSPTATPDSIVKEATSYIVEAARDEILRAVDMANKCKDYEELVFTFNKKYHAVGLPMAASRAHEITSKGIALFYFYKGDVKETLLAAVNFGRDTDCLAAVAAGIAGALNGNSGIPKEWIDTVDAATKLNDLTITQMTIKEMATGLYNVLMLQHNETKQNVGLLESMI